MRNPHWTKEEDNILIKNFETHTLPQLVKLLPGRNYNGVKARQTFLRICPVYTKDDTFFRIPNTLNASISGYTASDGHISFPIKGKRSHRISWGINTKDIKLLQDINFYLKSNYKITSTVKEAQFKSKTKKSYTYIDYKSRLCISTADQWAKDLLTHWNIPAGAKSLILGPPNVQDLNLGLAYIKGLIIGDGTILVTHLSDGDYIKLSLLGTERLLVWAKETLERFLGEKMDTIHVRPERTGANVFILCISGLKASRIIYKLNQLNTLTLDRKFKKPQVLAIIEKDMKKFPSLFLQN